MSVQTKLSKNTNSVSSHTSTVNSNITKMYFKVFSKQKTSTKMNNKDFSSHFVPNNYAEGKRHQEEVLKWLFNLPLKTRLKICSIDNKHLGNILHQMYVHSHIDNKVKFQMKPNSGNNEDNESYYPFPNNSSAVQFVNFNINTYPKPGENQNINNYTNYFLPCSYMQTNITFNNYLKVNDTMEKDFYKEIKFYQREEHNDTLALSPNFVTDENSFKAIFNYFSNDKFFTNPIEPSYDNTTKSHSLHLPYWINYKEYYSFGQYLVAFFEQVILVWFYFYKKMDSENFNKILQNQNSDKKITNLMEDMENVVNYLKKYLKSYDRKKLLEEVSFKGITQIIRKNPAISEIMSNKKKFSETIYTNMYNNRFYHGQNDRRTTFDLLEEVENNIRQNLYSKSEENFIHSLLFLPFEKIFTYDDFFSKQLYEQIHNLYTKQNALDLMNEENNDLLLKINTSPKKNNLPGHENKKRKNVKKTKRKRFESSSSSKEKNYENVLEETQISGNDCNNDEDSKEKIKSTLNFIIEKAACNVKFENIINKNSNELMNINDEYKSSETFENEDKKVVSKIKKKKEKNQFFLYTVNPHSRHSRRKNPKINTKINDKENNKEINKDIKKENNKESIKDSNKEVTKDNKKEILKDNIKDFSTCQEKNLDCSKDKENISLAANFDEEKDEKVTEENDKKPSRENISKSNPNIQSISHSYLNSQEAQSDNKTLENNKINITYNSPIYNNYFIINSNFSFNPNMNYTQQQPTENNKNPNNTNTESTKNSVNNLNTQLNNAHINNTHNIPNLQNSNLPSPNNNHIPLINPILNNNQMQIPAINPMFNPMLPPTMSPNISPNQPRVAFQPLFQRNINFKNNFSMPHQRQFLFDDFHQMNFQNKMFEMANGFPNLAPYDPFNNFSNYNRFHFDITEYSNTVNDNVRALKGLKFSIIKKIEEMVKDSLPEYNICMNLYGSYATELEIESSDIDITVKYTSKVDEGKINLGYNFSTDIVINRLVKSFIKKDIFDLVNPIYTATVPVIKLQIKLLNCLDENEKIIFENFCKSEKYLNYKFNKDELTKVRVDLTFLDTNKTKDNTNTKIPENPSLQAVEFVKSYLLCFPEIKPIIHVLKRLLQIEKLNSSFNGGLSSFVLFLIIFAFLKMRKFSPGGFNNNLGNILLEFFDFYANFNFNFNFIDVNSSNPFILSNEMIEQIPLILDPITYLNAGKSSFRIEDIKACFSKTSAALYNLVFKNNSERKNIINSLFEQKMIGLIQK